MRNMILVSSMVAGMAGLAMAGTLATDSSELGFSATFSADVARDGLPVPERDGLPVPE